MSRVFIQKAITYLTADGTVKPTSTIDMNNNKIIKLINSSEPKSAVNKEYVDTQVSKVMSNEDANFMKLDGTSLPTADLSMNNKALINLADSNDVTSAVNKEHLNTRITDLIGVTRGYVDTKNNELAATVLKLDGTSLPTADINMNNKRITNLATTTAPGDATSKGFCDSVYNKLTMTTNLNANNNRIMNVSTTTAAGDATSKNYCDLNYMKLLPTVDLNMNSHKILNLVNSTEATSGVNKGYVDGFLKLDGTTLPTANINMNTKAITGLFVNQNDATCAASVAYVTFKISEVNSALGNTDTAIRQYVDTQDAAINTSISNLTTTVNTINDGLTTANTKIKNIQTINAGETKMYNIGPAFKFIFAGTTPVVEYYCLRAGFVSAIGVTFFNTTGASVTCTINPIMSNDVVKDAYVLSINNARNYRKFDNTCTFAEGDILTFRVANFVAPSGEITFYLTALLEFVV